MRYPASFFVFYSIAGLYHINILRFRTRGVLHEMKRTNADRGLATLCIGEGQGIAMSVAMEREGDICSQRLYSYLWNCYV